MQPTASPHDPVAWADRRAGAVPSPEACSRIGPNAITRVAEAATERLGRAAVEALFRTSGLARHLAHPPEAMVAEDDVARLQAALRTGLDAHAAREIALDAGRRTGDYLLAHRIPRPAQALLKCLPAPLAARALVKAISRHAWTFAGSGRFTAAAGRPFVLTIAGCPLCREINADTPVCDYYAATFERIFGALVSRGARVTETRCQAAGAPACAFEVRW